MRILRSCSGVVKSIVMATIKLGQVVADIRGKVGGAVFSRNKGGAYMKAYTKPVNPNTPEQAAVRGLFGTLMSDWRALTAAERETWKKNAPSYPQTNKVGDTVFLSGSQLYAKANMTLIGAGLPRINNLPPNPIDLAVCFANQTLADANPFTFDSANPAPMTALFVIDIPEATNPLPANQYVQVWGTSQLSSGISSTRSVKPLLLGSFALNTFVKVGATNTFTLDIGSVLDAKFGLGPVIYNNDSSIVVSGRIYGDAEGIPIPIGTQFYKLVDIAP